MLTSTLPVPEPKSYPDATSPFFGADIKIRDRTHPDDHLLLWCLEGRGWVETSLGYFELTDGRAVVVPAGQKHSVVSLRGSVIYPVFFAASTIEVSSLGGVVEVPPEAAEALLLLSVAATTELSPSPRHLERLGAIVVRLLDSPAMVPSLDDLPPLFIPWVTNENEHVALWCVSGAVTVTIAGPSGITSVTLEPGLAIVVPPGRSHRVLSTPGNVTLPVFFAQLDIIFDEATVVLVDVFLRRAFHAQNLADNTLFRPEGWNDSAFTAALVEAFSAPCESRRTQVTSSVREYLLRDPCDTRGVGAWARTLKMSRRTLERTFAAETGESLGQWRDRLRMTVASSWLLEGQRAKQVTKRLGFANQSAFSRAFARHFGVSPREYTAAAPNSR